MTWLKRLFAHFTRRKDEQRLKEEFEQHLAMATDDFVRAGLTMGEARRQARAAFGGVEAMKDAYRDRRTLPWLESLAADTVFGWRQLLKNRTSSTAVILSLALATGASTSAFRLIDALLWRPLRVAEPHQLYSLTRVGLGFDGKPNEFDGWAYPAFELMRAAVDGQAELLAISYAERTDLTYRSDEEMEKANIQFVSGRMFRSFGLNPAAGRLLNDDDDRKPGAHPYTVLSHDYWTRRFGGDTRVIGRSVRFRDRIFEIVGVGPAGFTGTETGTVTDLFVPTMMQPSVIRKDSTWHRTIARITANAPIESIRQKLRATSQNFERERAKGFTGMRKDAIDRYINQDLMLKPAAAGASGLQARYRRSLTILGILVLLVLLIAGVNVANLMTSQAAARAREMAIRVSIGAGRGRLIQLVLVETAILVSMAALLGVGFAWWSAPFVVSQINPADNPVRLDLPADWRVVAFIVLLVSSVTILFGLLPALRASSVKPASALKGGDNPHSRARTMRVLIAAQVAFCFLVLFLAGLFAATFDRLSHRPLGFSSDGLLTLETIASERLPQPVWQQAAEHLRTLPGVADVAICSWPLLRGSASNSFISVNGAMPGPVLAYFLETSPNWIEVMKMRLLDGRTLRPDVAGEAVVNEAFVRQYFDGQNALGRSFLRGTKSYVVVGIANDTPYRSLREPIFPVAYTTFEGLTREETLIVRTASQNPLVLAGTLRREIPRANAQFRVSNVRTQQELIQTQTLRERLLTMLALFFAGVAVLLAGVGLYGVLTYSVLQRRREIGIRIAIGAEGAGIARLVTKDAFTMVLVGGAVGLGLGLASGEYLETLLYEVKPTDLRMLAIPSLAILASALIAALMPVLRAIRIDPVTMLRTD